MMRQHRWAFERGILYGIDLPGETPLCLPRTSAVFKEIGPESADALTAALGIADCKTVTLRFANRRRCFSAWIEDRIVAYGWVSQTSECIGEQERVIQIHPSEAYIWDCATLEEFRGRGLYSALLSHMVAALRNEGVRRIWIGSSLTNKSSRRGFSNAGFQPALTVVFARLFSIRFLFTASHSQGSNTLGSAARSALIADQEHAWGPVIIGRALTEVAQSCAEMEA